MEVIDGTIMADIGRRERLCRDALIELKLRLDNGETRGNSVLALASVACDALDKIEAAVERLPRGAATERILARVATLDPQRKALLDRIGSGDDPWVE